MSGALRDFARPPGLSVGLLPLCSQMRGEGRGAGYLLLALVIQSTVPTPNRDTSNICALIALLPYTT